MPRIYLVPISTPEPQEPNMLDKIAPYAKAVVAFLVPGLVALGAALTDASAGGSSVTSAEWVTILLAALGSGGATFLVPNKPYITGPIAPKDGTKP